MVYGVVLWEVGDFPQNFSLSFFFPKTFVTIDKLEFNQMEMNKIFHFTPLGDSNIARNHPPSLTIRN